MERFLTDKILNWCIRISPLPESQKTIVRYGIELFLDNILKTTLIVAAGFLIGQGPQTILVLIAFSGLRSKAGGFHMQTSLGCTGAMLTVWVGSLFRKLCCGQALGLQLSCCCCLRRLRLRSTGS